MLYTVEINVENASVFRDLHALHRLQWLRMGMFREALATDLVTDAVACFGTRKEKEGGRRMKRILWASCFLPRMVAAIRTGATTDMSWTCHGQQRYPS